MDQKLLKTIYQNVGMWESFIGVLSSTQDVRTCTPRAYWLDFGKEFRNYFWLVFGSIIDWIWGRNLGLLVRVREGGLFFLSNGNFIDQNETKLSQKPTNLNIQACTYRDQENRLPQEKYYIA